MRRAISCFNRQDYLNKELVISYPDNDLLTKAIVDQIEKSPENRIIRIERPASETLGTARNNAIEKATGDFICIWDDDDYHSSVRLSQQYHVLKDGPFKASILADVLFYDVEIQQAYHSGQRGWEGSLLCEKETLLKKRYMDSNKNEGEALLFFLSSENMLYYIVEMPHLYVYVYHNNNTTANCFFENFLLQSMPIDTDGNRQIQNIISLDQYQKMDF